MKEKLKTTEILFLPIPDEQDEKIISVGTIKKKEQSAYEHTSLNLNKNSLKATLSDLYMSFSEEFSSISKSINSPSEINIELSLAFSKKLNIWVANFEGEGSVKVSLKWNLGEK